MVELTKKGCNNAGCTDEQTVVFTNS